MQAGKVTVSLASHWTCVTDNSGTTNYRLTALEREMSPPMLQWSMADFILQEECHANRIAFSSAEWHTRSLKLIWFDQVNMTDPQDQSYVDKFARSASGGVSTYQQINLGPVTCVEGAWSFFNACV